jgi:hypothetical protein
VIPLWLLILLPFALAVTGTVIVLPFTIRQPARPERCGYSSNADDESCSLAEGHAGGHNHLLHWYAESD